jgi:hypothetical protein
MAKKHPLGPQNDPESLKCENHNKNNQDGEL